LIREEEKEISFWEGMRNTNHSDQLEGRHTKDNWKQSTNNDKEEISMQPQMISKVFKTDKPAAVDVKQSQLRPGEPTSESISGGSGRITSQNEKSKYRSKTFDKHHQKEKALRKMA